MRVILASSSSRRQELMKMFDIPFEIMVRETEEYRDKSVDCYRQCELIAQEKALKVFKETTDDVIVIGSDTVVIFQNEIYGKPKSYDEALLMLQNFSGKEHEVVSSICLMVRKKGKVYQELTYDKCHVYVDEMSIAEIKDWIKKHDVYTRAGAYAIQDGFAKYIKKIEGDYFSIVGLPVHKLYSLLKKYLEKEV